MSRNNELSFLVVDVKLNAAYKEVSLEGVFLSKAGIQ